MSCYYGIGKCLEFMVPIDPNIQVLFPEKRTPTHNPGSWRVANIAWEVIPGKKGAGRRIPGSVWQLHSHRAESCVGETKNTTEVARESL